MRSYENARTKRSVALVMAGLMVAGCTAKSSGNTTPYITNPHSTEIFQPIPYFGCGELTKTRLPDSDPTQITYGFSFTTYSGSGAHIIYARLDFGDGSLPELSNDPAEPFAEQFVEPHTYVESSHDQRLFARATVYAQVNGKLASAPKQACKLEVDIPAR